MNLQINIEEEADRTVVFLTGEIDIYTAPKLKEKLVSLVEEANSVTEVDMEQVNYMDSTGIGVFINALKSSKQAESKMSLIHLQERILRLFSITGLDDVIDIKSSSKGGN